MAIGDANERITVSREVLRAELAEMKLDLIEQFDARWRSIEDKLASKADRPDVHDLKNRVAALELTTLKADGPLVAQFEQIKGQLSVLVSSMEARREYGEALVKEFRVVQGQVDNLRRWRSSVLGAVAAISGSIGALTTILLHYL